MNGELTSLAYGLLAASFWGSGDFSGGIASKRNGVYSVVILSQIFGALLVAILAIVFSETVPPYGDLLWAAAAGLSGTFGIMMLYSALAAGRMSIAAPVAALLTAAIPVIFAALFETLPSPLDWVGFGLAFASIWIVSRPEDNAAVRLQDLKLPILAGLGFGIFFILIARASEESLFWSLTVARLTSLSTLILIARFMGHARLPQPKYFPLILLAGFLDTGGNAFFALGAQAGRLDIASISSSLYPAMTVMLAFLILKEKITRLQLVGVLGMLAAIVLIAV